MRLDLSRINLLWFISLGFTLLAMSLLVYIYLIESVFGPISIKEAIPRDRLISQPQVALLASEYTRLNQRVLNPSDTADAWYKQTISWWQHFLKHRNISTYALLSDQDIESGALKEYKLLILPATHTLSDQEIQEIESFLEQGGNILATWMPGLYYPDGSWRGWRFIEQTFGVIFEDFVQHGYSHFQTYVDTFPGTALPGLYRPKVDIVAPPADSFKATMQHRAAQFHFPPLQAYVWVDTLGAPPPLADYALADTLSLWFDEDQDGQIERHPAVVITYYTWLGYDPQAIAPYPTTSPGIRRLTLRGSTPLTAQIPGGYRLKVTVYDPPIQVRIAEPRAHSAGFWFDFFRDASIHPDPLNSSTGIVYGTYGKGRFVYFTFPLTNTGIDDEDRRQLNILSDNTLYWLHRQAIAWVSDWPAPYEAAAFLAGTTGQYAKALRNASRIFQQNQIPATFFIAEPHLDKREFLLQLGASFELGLMDSLMHHTQGTLEQQIQRLRRLKNQLEAVSGQQVIGYHPSRPGRLAPSTLRALIETRFKYTAVDSISRQDTPRILGYPFHPLTEISLTAHTDKDVYAKAGMDSALRRAIYLEDIQRIAFERGLYTLYFSSDLLATPPLLPDLQFVIQQLKRHHFWIASGKEIEYWWRIKQGLHTGADTFGKRRIRIRISNNNGASVDRMNVLVALGYPVKGIEMIPEIIGTPLPDYSFLDADSTLLLLKVTDLKPQQYRNILINLYLKEDHVSL